MRTEDWVFPPLGGGNEQGYTDQGIEAYKGKDLVDNLAREICQNSLDAKDTSNDEPVIVEFNLRHLNRDDYDVFVQFKKRLKGCREYWGDRADEKLSAFLDGAKEALKKKKIPTLVMSDYNTKGLTGSRVTDRNQKSVFRALTHSDGTSVKEKGSGGSFGVGKNACFACSDLSMVFYNTYAKDNQKAFKGVARVATLLQNDQETQRVGHYQKKDDSKPRPIYEEDHSRLRDEFSRDEFGTDVIIFGFIEEDQWQTLIKKAILKHFFLAIHQKKLEVLVDGGLINSVNIKDHFDVLLKNDADNDLIVASQMYDAVVDEENKDLHYESIKESNDICLHLKLASEYKRYMGYFRKTGMMVGKRQHRVMKRFAAVLEVQGEELNDLLKHAEPARHTRWDHKIIPNSQSELRKEAKKAIDKIHEWTREILESQKDATQEDSIDAGVEDYLPAELEDIASGKSSKHNDVLLMKPTISDEYENQPGQFGPSSGEQDKDMVPDGRRANPDSQGGGNSSEDDDGPEPKDDTPVPPSKEGPGKKRSIRQPKLVGRRTIPINSEKGLYRVILETEESYDNLYMSFTATGEDGKSDNISIDYFMVDNKKRTMNGNSKIGPISTKERERKELTVKLDMSEKVLIGLTITEEVQVSGDS